MNNIPKERYTKEELEQAQRQDIVEYLNFMGYGLKKEGYYYRGENHDSMVINSRNGKWSWNSKDLKGNRPVELLKQILIYDFGYDEKSAFISAIKKLARTEGQNLDYQYNKNQNDNRKVKDTQVKRDFILPKRNATCDRIIAYLCNARGLDYDIVKSLILKKKIYETERFHNVCFVAYDKNNVPKHAFLRGTYLEKSFKQDIENSKKEYGFTLMGSSNSNKVYCFESAIDAISHATLYKINNNNYINGHRLSLHGTSSLALEEFLKNNPKIEEIIFCLDNDDTGIRRSEKLCVEFSEKNYRTFKQIPQEKDYNEQLKKVLENKRELEFEYDMEWD